MKRYSVILVSLVMILALILTACGSPTPAPAPAPAPAPTSGDASPAPAPAPAPTSAPAPAPVGGTPKTIKFAYTMPKGASVGAGFEWFAVEFEKRTNGRYKVDTYPAQSLFKLASSMDSVKTGVAEMCYTSTGTFPRQFPLYLVTGLPTLGFPSSTVEIGVAGYKAYWELYEAVPEIQNEFKDVVFLNAMLLDPYNIVSKRKEIIKAEDFRGLKIGGSGEKMEIVKRYGGAHVQMIPPESYLSLDKGVVDAGFLTFSQVRDYKLHEICNWYSSANFGNGGGIVIMNKEFYNSMSPEDQKILKETMMDSREPSVEGSQAGINAGMKLIRDAGHPIHEPTAEENAAWAVAAEPAIEDWRNTCRIAGVSDDVIKKVYNDWMEIRAKYYKEVGLQP